uniref:Uncharacterized protein n=1 Tax=Arundo donax TaxID=35708 RepID=A0A0A8XZZ6_ARUDO
MSSLISSACCATAMWRMKYSLLMDAARATLSASSPAPVLLSIMLTTRTKQLSRSSISKNLSSSSSMSAAASSSSSSANSSRRRRRSAESAAM